jgi:hypothetical protein
MKKLLTLVLIFLISSQNSAEALFGSECKKPKSTVASLIKQIDSSQKKLNSAYGKQSRIWKTVVLTDAMRKERYKSCIAPSGGIELGEEICRGMLAPYPKTVEECSVSNSICTQVANQIYSLTTKIEKLKNNQAQVIVNNQKCFDPLVVVQAQEEVKY